MNENMLGTKLMSFPAGEALTNYQYHFVKITSGEIFHCNNAADVPIGIVQDCPANIGDPCAVALLGSGAISKVVSDGSGTPIVEMSHLGTDGNGHAIVKGTNKDLVAGRALDAGTVAGTVIRVMLCGPMTVNI